MKKLKSDSFLFFVAVLLVTIHVNPVFSQSGPAKKAGSNSISFNYRYPAEQPVHYISTQKILQTMDINGEQMKVRVESLTGCFVSSAGNQGNNLRLEIRVDTMSQTIDSPQGLTGGNINDSKGKTFKMVITSKGKQVDISEAQKIKLSTESGSVNLSQTFSGFFPLLPEGEVRLGFTWPSTDTIVFSSEELSMQQVVKAKNVLEGFENILGIECAKITSAMEGTWLMKNQAQGMDMNLNGTFTGNGTTYFAPKEGYFIRNTATLNLKGALEFASPQSMTIPLVMDITTLSEAKK